MKKNIYILNETIKKNVIIINNLLYNIKNSNKLLISFFKYKYLSDRFLFKASFLLEEPENNLQESQNIYVEAWQDDARQSMINDLKSICGYFIEPFLTINGLYNKIKLNQFKKNDLNTAFTKINIQDTSFQNVPINNIPINVIKKLLIQLSSFAVINPDDNNKTNILKSYNSFIKKYLHNFM